VDWAAVSAISQVVAAIGVIATLFYLAVQIRGSNKVASAQSRHTISELAFRFAVFRADNADRFSRIESESELTDADRLFQYWSHVQLMLHAETYFHHHELGLMPDGHWRGYERFMTRYVQSPGFAKAWADIGPSFSENFARWVDMLLDTSPRDTRAVNVASQGSDAS